MVYLCMLVIEQDYADAQFWLGLSYDNRWFITEKNFMKAKELYEKAANQGHSAAQYYLGVMYYEGRGIEKNIRKAKEWFEKATEQGFPNALAIQEYN